MIIPPDMSDQRIPLRPFAHAYQPLLGCPIHSVALERALRVNHAGEEAAVWIYRGQLRLLAAHSTLRPLLEHMLAQEEVHCHFFRDLLPRYHMRPSILLPFWQWAGYMLGISTALLGEKAAMMCTYAVESEIDEHYADQLPLLAAYEPQLYETIERFRQEECDHKDIAIEQAHLSTRDQGMLYRLIRWGSRMAIACAKRY